MLGSLDREAISTVVEEHLCNRPERIAELAQNVALAVALLDLHVHESTSGPAKEDLISICLKLTIMANHAYLTDREKSTLEDSEFLTKKLPSSCNRNAFSAS